MDRVYTESSGFMRAAGELQGRLNIVIIELRRLSAILFSIASLGMLAVYYFNVLRYGELSEKKGYAALQSIEYRYRNSKNSNLYLINDNNSYVLGLKTANQEFPYSWIFLNQLTSNGQFFMMPESHSFDVNCPDISLAIAQIQTKEVVRDFLAKACRK